MQYSTKAKILIISVIAFTILVMSLGFAFFSGTLNIKPSADISPDATTFNVGLSTSSSEIIQGSVIPSVIYSEDYFNNKMVSASTATISTRGEISTIENLGVTFTEPGQSVTYTFYAYNAGKYVAYLNSVAFNNVEDESSFKVCEPVSGTTSEDTIDACNSITVSVTIGSDTYTSQNMNINNHSLGIGASDTIVVTISYSGENDLDGDVYVKYGSITLTYSSAD